MAKITFIQRLWYEYPGVEFISAVLKKHGHKVRVIIEDLPKRIIRQIGNDGIAAFSVTTGMHHWGIEVAMAIKKELRLPTVFGGPHPTYFPEFINEDGVDIICIGEGEYPMLDLANAIDNNYDLFHIKNMWVKKNGIVHKNPLRPLIDDLDAIPFPDRSIYYQAYPVLRNSTHKIFLASRGCPFECTFCFNDKLKNLYSGLGRYVRFRSSANVVEEIRQVRKYYPFKTVFFNDDIFILNNKWLNEFLPLYQREIGLPFYASARADTLCEDTVKLLKDAGCKCLSFAIESGNERIRNKILNKKITNEQILYAASLLKRYGIKFATYNMVGIPGETIENIFETVNINIKISTDYPRCSFLTPYPGTKIAEYANRIGCLESESDSLSPFSQQSCSVIKLRDRGEMINLHSFFQTMVLFPRIGPLIRWIIKMPPNLFFRLWWFIIYFIIFTKSEGRTFREMAIFAFQSRHSFFETRASK